MNRIDQTFKSLKEKKKKAFIAFITAGDPDLKTTEKLVLEFERQGVDLVELGVPFSDPLADGPTIQASSQRALAKGTTLPKILETVRNIRKQSEIPLVLMTYYNSVFHFGEEKFVVAAKQAGVDGVVVPDLPVEEAAGFIRAAKKRNFCTIFFLSPTTGPQRRKKILRAATGFVYYVSLTGVTGARTTLPDSIKKNVLQAKKLTKKPVCVGFGVSTPGQVKSLGKISDGVIVGSAIVKEIEKYTGQKNLVERVGRFVSVLSRGG
jgi:tryptophan synthase alpha chain